MTVVEVDAADLHAVSQAVDHLEEVCRAVVVRSTRVVGVLHVAATALDRPAPPPDGVSAAAWQHERSQSAADARRAAGLLETALSTLLTTAGGLGVSQGAARRAWHAAKKADAPEQRPDKPSKATSDRAAAIRDVVKMASSQVGVQERNNNLTRYGKWYGMDGQPWCGMFVSWAFHAAGHKLPPLQGTKGFAGVRSAYHDLQRRGMIMKKPRVGDIWMHLGPVPARDHTGIVVKVGEGGTFWTVEGNAGDAVRKVRHNVSEGSMAFGRIR